MTLEEELVISHLTKKDRGYVISHAQELRLSPFQKIRYQLLKYRLRRGVPLPYVLGFKEWYGRKFFVNCSTLIPRPETELMIELVKESIGAYTKPLIVDIGTGSGCIAVTAALEFPRATVIATDVSSAALRTAKKNSRHLKARVEFLHGSALKPLAQRHTEIANNFDHVYLTANLPYIPTKEYLALPDSIKKFEPRTALDGGPDGLRYYQILFAELSSSVTAPFTVYCEIMPDQSESITQLAEKIFQNSTIMVHKDLAGLQRIVEITLI